MEDLDWVEDLDALDDSEFFSPSAAIAQRLSRGLRRSSSRKVVPAGARPGAAVSPPVRSELSKVYEAMKRLESKQEETTKQLALLQSRSAGLQSADLFRQSLSAAVANAVSPIAANGDWYSALAQAMPVGQNLQGATASFKAKPVSTIAFPVAAFAAIAFKRPKKVEIIATALSIAAVSAAGIRVSLYSRDGGTIRYTLDGKDVTKSSDEYKGPFFVAKVSTLKAKAFLLFRESEQESVDITA